MVFHMNSGTGEFSYAKNSFLQETVTRKAWPVLEETIKQMVNSLLLPQCFNIADLGCSAGSNSLLVMSNIISTINNMLCLENHPGITTPEFQVFLNDLPENDFNTLFKSLPEILDRGKGANFGSTCLIYGVPGSFYGRLFPKESMHIIHSSYSLHWLSQVPEGLESNKGNIYMARTSPPNVFEAYLNQFQKDFFRFLQLRSVEIVPKGRMVLTYIGRSLAEPTSRDCCAVYELQAKSLLDLVTEGLIQEAEVDSFNLAHYTPYKDEVKDIIQEEGSFALDRLDTFQVNWDGRDDDDSKLFVFDSFSSGKMLAKSIRAVMEPILASHFGSNIIDNLFERYAGHLSEHLRKEKTKYYNIVVSLSKK